MTIRRPGPDPKLCEKGPSDSGHRSPRLIMAARHVALVASLLRRWRTDIVSLLLGSSAPRMSVSFISLPCKVPGSLHTRMAASLIGDRGVAQTSHNLISSWAVTLLFVAGGAARATRLGRVGCRAFGRSVQRSRHLAALPRLHRPHGTDKTKSGTLAVMSQPYACK